MNAEQINSQLQEWTVEVLAVDPAKSAEAAKQIALFATDLTKLGLTDAEIIMAFGAAFVIITRENPKRTFIGLNVLQQNAKHLVDNAYALAAKDFVSSIINALTTRSGFATGGVVPPGTFGLVSEQPSETTVPFGRRQKPN